MSADDPRRRKVLSFIEWFEARKDARDADEFLRQWSEYTTALEAIAADPAVSPKERIAAQEILDELAVAARAHTANAIRRVVELAADNDSIAPDVRADAKRLLADITERLPPASDKVQ
jgi:hypothetical protein